MNKSILQNGDLLFMSDESELSKAIIETTEKYCQRQAIITITSQEKIAKISQKETATIIIKQKFLKYVLTNNAQKRSL